MACFSKLIILGLLLVVMVGNVMGTSAFLRKAAEADALQPGDTTPIVLEEMGVEGQARVIAVEPCPTLDEGEGELVTATFSQHHLDIRQLHLTGLAQPIEVTGSHPIFSEDRKDFIAAKDLLPGERLRTRTGTATIERLDRKPGSWQVFNLEIGSIHRYYISTLDVLVHNTCGGETEFTATGRQAYDAYSKIWEKEGYEMNKPLPSGLRPDAIKYFPDKLNPTEITIRELKPDNPQAMSRGYSQLNNYTKELLTQFPEVRVYRIIDTYLR